MKTLSPFVSKLFESFEEDGEAEELAQFGELCKQVRGCFLAGDVLDAEHEELAKLTTALYVEAKRTSTDSMILVDRGLALLAEFADAKASATRARLRGKMVVALRYEERAEVAYNQLPQPFRW